MSNRNYIRVRTKRPPREVIISENLVSNRAEALLARNGFMNVQSLNAEQANHSYADIYAEKDGERYVISVKTRNKLQASGTLNGSYNLSSLGNHYELAGLAENARQAKAAWIAISVEETVFNAYFGLLADLNGKNGIPMTEAALSTYQCLAKNEPHGLDYSEIKNVYEDVSATRDKIEVNKTPDAFAAIYPNVSAWVQSGGYVEIGQTSYELPAFVKALDEGGMVWEGETEYASMDAAFQALESGLAAYVEEQGIDL